MGAPNRSTGWWGRPWLVLAIGALVAAGPSAYDMLGAVSGPAAAATLLPTATRAVAPSLAPEPTATPTRVPARPSATRRPTPSAKPTPTPTLPPLPDRLGDAVDIDRLVEHVERLDAIAVANGGSRLSGTPALDAAASYVSDSLAALGYQVGEQQFIVPTFTDPGTTRLEVLSGDKPTPVASDEVIPMQYSPAGTVTARVVAVGYRDGVAVGCGRGEFTGTVHGRIVLLLPGSCARKVQVANAARAGAAAVIVAYWSAVDRASLRRGTVDPSDPAGVPAVGVTVGVGRAVARAAARGEHVRLTVTGTTKDESSVNVFASAPGSDPSGRVILIGAHLDSVEGPGANDNASGVSVVLELARILAGRRVEGHEVEFSLWSGEEQGTYGSRAFVDSLAPERRDSIAAYINLDTLASPNGGNFVSVVKDSGSEWLRDLALEACRDRSVPCRHRDRLGYSDDASFAAAGIPSIDFTAGGVERKPRDDASLFGGIAGERYHPCHDLACDTAGAIDASRLEVLARVAVDLLDRLASAQ